MIVIGSAQKLVGVLNPESTFPSEESGEHIPVRKASPEGPPGPEAEGPAASAAIAAAQAAPANPLEDALSALERRDYATARRLFEALGRKDAADAIDNALTALDRKDFATAQGLFEALAPSRPPPPPVATAGPRAGDKEQPADPAPAPEAIPTLRPEDRPPAPRPAQTGKPRSKARLLAAGVALLAIAGAAFFYASHRKGTLIAEKRETSAGLASAGDVVEAPPKTFVDPAAREEERAAVRDAGAALARLTTRLDRIEKEHDARFDALGQRIDQNAASGLSASGLAEVTARLDALEKKVSAPAAPVPALGAVAQRLDKLEKRAAPSPAPDLAEIRTRLDRLEKKVAAASSVAALPPAASRHAAGAARVQSSPPTEAAGPYAPRPMLQGYSVEDVQDGVAVVDSRYGPVQVAPGDYLPGAGRVLRIERRGGDWTVVTSGGVIASGFPPY